MVKDNFVHQLVQGDVLSATGNPKSYPKNVPTKMKPTKIMPSKRKKIQREKRMKRGGEKVKRKSQECCVDHF